MSYFDAIFQVAAASFLLFGPQLCMLNKTVWCNIGLLVNIINFFIKKKINFD